VGKSERGNDRIPAGRRVDALGQAASATSGAKSGETEITTSRILELESPLGIRSDFGVDWIFGTLSHHKCCCKQDARQDVGDKPPKTIPEQGSANYPVLVPLPFQNASSTNKRAGLHSADMAGDADYEPVSVWLERNSIDPARPVAN
jgi:hypothetical protein